MTVLTDKEDRLVTNPRLWTPRSGKQIRSRNQTLATHTDTGRLVITRKNYSKPLAHKGFHINPKTLEYIRQRHQHINWVDIIHQNTRLHRIKPSKILDLHKKQGGETVYIKPTRFDHVYDANQRKYIDPKALMPSGQSGLNNF